MNGVFASRTMFPGVRVLHHRGIAIGQAGLRLLEEEEQSVRQLQIVGLQMVTKSKELVRRLNTLRDLAAADYSQSDFEYCTNCGVLLDAYAFDTWCIECLSKAVLRAMSKK